MRRLIVSNARWTATADFERDADGAWRCIRADPEVYWFRHTPIDNLRTFLTVACQEGKARRQGWSYRWENR